MATSPIVAATTLALLAGGTPLQILQGADDEPPLVTLSAVCDAAAVAPGTRVTLAVTLAIAEGWHVYWSNPGDGGLPTRIEVEAPPGWAVGEARLPGPHWFELPGGIVNFGYEDRAVVLVTVTAPEDVEPGREAELVVRGDWLVCREACLFGEGEARLVLPVAATTRPAPEATRERIAAARARLPRPPDPDRPLERRWSSDGLAVRVPDASALAFFPAAPGPDGAARAPGATLDIPLAGPRIEGVLLVRRDGGETWYRLDAEPARSP